MSAPDSSDPNTTFSSPLPANLPPAAVDLATKLFWAARNGDMPLLSQALSLGLPANLTNDKGDTLLMLSAYHGHAEAVQLLLEKGADPNRLNDRGQSPLAGAVFKLESEVIDALVKGGADPEYGMPNAIECIAMFKQDRWKEVFEQAPGRGKMGGRGVEQGTKAQDVNGPGDVPKTEDEMKEAYIKAHAPPGE